MTFPQWLISNNGLKVVAFVAASFIWFFVRAVTSGTRTVESVPLEFKTPPGLTATYATPRSVNVTVRGTTEDLRQASRYELFAVIDLQQSAEHAGNIRAPITLRDIRHPPRIQVVAVEPGSIIVHIEKSAD